MYVPARFHQLSRFSVCILLNLDWYSVIPLTVSVGYLTETELVNSLLNLSQWDSSLLNISQQPIIRCVGMSLFQQLGTCDI